MNPNVNQYNNPHVKAPTPVSEGQVLMTFPVESALAGGVIGKKAGAYTLSLFSST